MRLDRANVILHRGAEEMLRTNPFLQAMGGDEMRTWRPRAKDARRAPLSGMTPGIGDGSGLTLRGRSRVFVELGRLRSAGRCDCGRWMKENSIDREPAFDCFRTVSSDLAQCYSPEEFDAAARRSLVRYDALNADLIARNKVRLDCCEGCSICCWLRVEVFAHEIFLIVHHLRSAFTADALASLMDRLDAHAARIRPLTPFAHATQNHVCPLLQNGRCSIYAVRPHSCRRHHSQDVAVCQFTFDHPTDLESPAAHDREVFRALTEGMRDNLEAYAELGYDSTFYELGTALHEALHDPLCEERWRSREQAFLHASITPTE